MLSSTYRHICLILSFSEVYRSFTSVERYGLFLDVLAPYVLNDRLIYATPEVMANFVEHCHGIDDVFAVERFLLHMDVTTMDFDSILILLRKSEMYTALLHLYASGLNNLFTIIQHFIQSIKDCSLMCLNHMCSTIDNIRYPRGYGEFCRALSWNRWYFYCRTIPPSLGCNHNGLWFNSYITKKKWNVHSSPPLIRKWIE